MGFISIQDLTGLRFSRLTVLKASERPKSSSGQYYWHCRCDCGVEKEAQSYHLRSGHTRSCGCLSREAAGIRSRERNLRHGDTSSPEWICWVSMRQRCLSPDSKSYPGYGGRGITICERWGSFEAFLSDMGRKPHPECSIDRIDNEGSYSPENCHWATKTQQTRNRRNTRMVSVGSQTKTIQEWADSSGHSYARLYDRIFRSGWDAEKAINSPVQEEKRNRRLLSQIGLK